jgi:hypothetical protein
MLELIITLLVILPIITFVTIYVIEYREISLHKKEMEIEWNRYSNESNCTGIDKDGTPIQLFNKEE